MKLHLIFIYVVRFLFSSLTYSTYHSVSSSCLLLIIFQAMIFVHTFFICSSFFFVFSEFLQYFCQAQARTYTVAVLFVTFAFYTCQIQSFRIFFFSLIFSISKAPARNFISNQCSVLRELNVCYKVKICFKFIVCFLSFFYFSA